MAGHHKGNCLRNKRSGNKIPRCWGGGLFLQFTAVDDYGGEEIDGGLYPQGDDFGTDILYPCAHGVHGDEALYAESAGEQVAEPFPYLWDIACRPRYSCHEEEGNAGEDYDEEYVLALADDAHGAHAEEDAWHEERQEEEQEVFPVDDAYEAEICE